MRKCKNDRVMRIVKTMAAMLTVGFISTICITCILAFFGPAPAFDDTSDAVTRLHTSGEIGNSGHWANTHCGYYKAFGATSISCSVNVAGETYGVPSLHNELEFVQTLPEWARAKLSEPLGSTTANWRWLLDSRGWPLRALSCTALQEKGQPWIIRCGFGIRMSPDRPVFVPLRPIWQGLAMNTLLYALASIAVYELMSRVIQASRFRRGRCPRCRYDLRFDYRTGCSECGWRCMVSAD